MSVYLRDEFNSFVSENYKPVISDISSAAQKYGFKIYLIGGIVRDLILHKPVFDVDITVEGDVFDFCKILEKETDCEIIAVQKNLHTVKIKFKNGTQTDIASTREEKYSQSGVLPCAYNFGCNLNQDIKRRDFTMNTLALNLTGENKFFLSDFCGGYQDIKDKKIKILHDKSFIDDPSRIIRALKFQVRFDFDIEEKTFALMQNYLDNVSRSMPLERIKNEFIQYFSIKKTGIYDKIIQTKAYKLISDNPVLNFSKNISDDLLSYNLFDENDLWLIYFILLIIHSDFANNRLNLTSREKKVIKEVKIMLSEFPENINDKVMIYNKFNGRLNLSIAIYYILTQDSSVKEYLTELKQIKVLITGDDLINLGFAPSPYFNELFEKILREKLYGNLKEREEEIEFVKQFLKK